ncbi:MAG TPA: hypothetical protein VD969_18005 [Symbiobacteriaceae bacterium]|nr:hypothetical protein [Symbiobacteriaceae bacterium]
MGLIPPNYEAEIPYRAVVPRRVDGLLVTGKAITGLALPPDAAHWHAAMRAGEPDR